MATTTNFGWETPDDTDLVKDGAAAMRTLGNSIDTSFVDLKGGTTGQVLAKASNTDLDFTWAADASGIPATIFDAKGDIIAATGADAAARLAVGTNDQVLTADSSTATGLKWATAAGWNPNFQLINAGGTALSGAQTCTINFSAKNEIYIQIDGASSANAYAYFQIRPNNDSTTKYSGYGLAWKNSATWGYSAVALSLNLDDSIQWGGGASTATSTSSLAFTMTGTNSAGSKPYSAWSYTSGSDGYSYLSSGLYTGSSALTSVVIRSTSGNFDAGTVYVYGA